MADYRFRQLTTILAFNYPRTSPAGEEGQPKAGEGVLKDIKLENLDK